MAHILQMTLDMSLFEFIVVLLGRIAVLRTYMRPIVADQVVWYVGRSVCLSVTLVSPAEMGEPIEMPFC